MNLQDYYSKFPNREDCIYFLENCRWSNTPICPYCNSDKSSKTKSKERYHCNNCNMSYSVTVNTIFHRTRLDLQKWFYAINYVLKSSIKVTSRNLAQEIDTTKDTAWLVLKKIRQSILDNDTLIKKIHIDENS